MGHRHWTTDAPSGIDQGVESVHLLSAEWEDPVLRGHLPVFFGCASQR